MPYNKQKYIEIIDDPAISTSELYERLKNSYGAWSYWNMEELNKNFPPPKKKTVRYFLNVQEADEQHKNKSANDLEKKGIEGITLRERLIMEDVYFKQTGNHLDVENITLCSGSRSSDGLVPRVNWGAASRGVFVFWLYPSDSYSGLRARAVVNLNLSSASTFLDPSTSASTKPHRIGDYTEVAPELDDYTLHEAIQTVKDAGYKVIKEY